MLILNRLILDQLPGCIGWKDTNFKYLGGNKSLLSIKRLKDESELIGCDDKSLVKPDDPLLPIFQQQDILVLLGQSFEMIHAEECDGKENVVYSEKVPLKDDNSTIIGVLFHCRPWAQSQLFKLLTSIDQKYMASTEVSDYYSFDQHHNTAQLSERELECLFLQIRGKSAKQIGDILGLSKRTVESYADNIKSKMGCQNKSELLVKATSQGYQCHVPKRFLNLDLKAVLEQ